MAEITAALVKELREKSGAGMMDCKKALQENAGDIEQSMDWLRTKGLSKAAKKSERAAAEGLVAAAMKEDGRAMTAVLIELNAETDFVARNELFQTAARKAARAALDADSVEQLNDMAVESGETVGDMVTNLIATIGENMMVRRMAKLTTPNGAVATYIHNAAAPDLGRIGVLVALEGDGEKARLIELGRKIAMHVAATQPLSLSVNDLDPAAVERERAIFSEQAAASGKPAGVIEKMVEGRLRKFYEEVVLTKQAFVMNPDQTIEQLVEAAGKESGSSVKLTGFARLALGEGVEKKQDDFAAEVASMQGQPEPAE
jgi:elongation factor Ts